MKDCSYVERNYDRIRSDVERLCAREGVRPADVVCVTKSASDDEVRALVRCGATAIGENRVQNFLLRRALVEGSFTGSFHLIGSLQTNKVKYLPTLVDLIHSVDSDRLLDAIERESEKHGAVTDVLLEVNSGGEASKGGASFDDLPLLAAHAARLAHVRLRGLMTMAPHMERAIDYYPYFEKTRLALDALRPAIAGDAILSMGMSDSYEAAIACGANMLRIGRALFRP